MNEDPQDLNEQVTYAKLARSCLGCWAHALDGEKYPVFSYSWMMAKLWAHYHLDGKDVIPWTPVTRQSLQSALERVANEQIRYVINEHGNYVPVSDAYPTYDRHVDKIIDFLKGFTV